ncbi:MAG: restriction endonuclease [Deltaproteobacteria bacterium]|nr:restriction endonuclease [Deltaproteobacteria bacterium]MBI3389447.1 restriction endonuclease [Deltaproteobacteria bacterium]
MTPFDAQKLKDAMVRTLELHKHAAKMSKGGFLRTAWSPGQVDSWLQEQLFETWKEYLFDCAERHMETLLRKRRNLLVRGDYGEIDDEPLLRELRHFLSACNVTELVMERIGDALCTALYLTLETLADAVPIQETDAVALSLETSPTEYEHQCAELMRTCGFEATVTKASGDQGVDVIARKPGLTVALQCKLYGSPVGNKAVQEIYAAKSFVGADLAVVVTNNEFTDPARQLAQALGVLLLHDSQIAEYFGK